MLKFNYDATTPHVSITLSIYPSPRRSSLDATRLSGDGKSIDRSVDIKSVEEDVKVIYSGVHEGGFNQSFTMPAHAALDLSSAISPLPPPDLNEPGVNAANDDAQNKNGHARRESRAGSDDTDRTSMENQMGNLRLGSSTQPDLATVPEGAQADQTDRRPSRFLRMFSRNRQRDLESGQIEMTEQNGDGQDADAEKGMRLLIRIEAVGPEGEWFRSKSQTAHV